MVSVYGWQIAEESALCAVNALLLKRMCCMKEKEARGVKHPVLIETVRLPLRRL